MTSVLSLMGPHARALLGRVGAPTPSLRSAPEQLRFATTREIDLGFARVRAARMSYVGGPGFELYVPIEMARHVWLALHEASEGLGVDGGSLADAGYYALDALRIEAGRRAWGAELGPDDTPFEAGTMFAVKLAKRDDFIGKTALVAHAATSRCARSSSPSSLDIAEAWAWGGEALLIDGVRSAKSRRRAGATRPVAASRSATFAAMPRRAPTPAARSRSTCGATPVAASAWDSWNPAAAAAPAPR